METELKLDALEEIGAEGSSAFDVRRHEGYDHSYFFISSFIEDHLRFYAKYLI